MDSSLLVLVVVMVGGILTLAYWLLVATEGAYLGPRVVIWLYDRFAPRYDRIKEFNVEDDLHFLGRPIARFLAAQIADPAAAEKPRLLDVATGTGRLPLAVLQASGGACHVTALDLSRQMLRRAQQKLAAAGWRDVEYHWHTAQRLPFADGRFQVVTCLEALEFFPDPLAALAELTRVAQPGGLLVLTNRIGPEARVMPGRSFSRERFADLLRGVGCSGIDIITWQLDYDLVFAVKREPL